MNHYRNMDGAYSFAFSPYWNEGLTAEFYNPVTDGVWDVEDMYRAYHTLYLYVSLSIWMKFKLCISQANCVSFQKLRC